jgi:hypothetical protein
VRVSLLTNKLGTHANDLTGGRGIIGWHIEVFRVLVVEHMRQPRVRGIEAARLIAMR